MDPKERQKLYDTIAAFCGNVGTLTDHSHELIELLIDSIDTGS